MILFLHSAFSSSSSLIGLIRSMLDLDLSFSDRFVLDTFTISMPGYYTHDEVFDTKNITQRINQFVLSNSQIQQKIASKNILGTLNQSQICLKDEKLNIVGVDAGGSLGLMYCVNNPDSCSSLVLLDCSYNYGGVWNKIRRLQVNKLFELSIDKLQSKISRATSLNYKVFLTLLHDNLSNQGVKGFVNFMFDFDFSKMFSNLTISQQHSFNKIQILSLLSRGMSLPTKSSQKKMYKLLHPDNNMVRAKHTIILVDQSKKNHFDYKVVTFPNKYILDNQNLDLICSILQEFYKTNIL